MQRAAAVRGGGLAPISHQVVSRWFTPAFSAREPGVPARFVATLERDVQPEGYAGCCEAITDMDLRPSLPAITAPTLVIAGSEDPATPPWHGAVIARGIPGSRLRVIRGAAHLANVSNPAEVTAALATHLDGPAEVEAGTGDSPDRAGATAMHQGEPGQAQPGRAEQADRDHRREAIREHTRYPATARRQAAGQQVAAQQDQGHHQPPRSVTASELLSSMYAWAQECACGQMPSQYWQSAAGSLVPGATAPTNDRPNSRFIAATTSPLAPTASSPIEPSFQADITRSASAARLGTRCRWTWCARTTTRPARNSRSRPPAFPLAEPGGQPLGDPLPQVIVGLGEQAPPLPRRPAQPGVQLIEVILDEIPIGRAHASPPAVIGPVAGNGPPVTAWMARANRRHSPRSAASAVAPWLVSA